MVKRILGYIVLVFVLAITGALYESYELMMLLLFVLFLPVLLFGMLWFTRRNLVIMHSIPKDKVYKGEYIPIVLTIDNKGIFPIVMMRIEVECINELYNQSTKEVFEIPTLKRGEQKFSFSMKSKYCGNIKIILKQIKIADYLYFFTLKKDINLTKVIPVIPDVKIIECDNVTVNTAVMIDGEYFSKTQKGDDPSEVFDIREYHEGDSLHSVHWKLSAKKDELIVKELSMPLSSGIVIMLEMYISAKGSKMHKYVESVLETAIAISLKLQDCGYVHHIAWYDELSDSIKRMKVTEETNVTLLIMNIYQSRIYNTGLKLVKMYNSEYYDEIESHIYYISCAYSEENVDNLRESREGAIINYLYVTEGEDKVSDDMTGYIYANNEILQIIEYSNLNNTIESLIL